MTRARRFLIPVGCLAVRSLTAPDGLLAPGSRSVYGGAQAERCHVLERPEQAGQP
jgi:hypothetical protein